MLKNLNNKLFVAFDGKITISVLNNLYKHLKPQKGLKSNSTTSSFNFKLAVRPVNEYLLKM